MARTPSNLDCVSVSCARERVRDERERVHGKRERVRARRERVLPPRTKGCPGCGGHALGYFAAAP